MIAVVQRVSRAEVRIAGREPASIERGLLILLGVARGDDEADARWLARKCLSLRIFSDERGHMERGLDEIGGGILAISQFTLLGDCVKGRRPSWSEAAEPALAERLYDLFVAELRRSPHPVRTGVFQAKMEVESVNDGPVTLIIDSRDWKAKPADAQGAAAGSQAKPADAQTAEASARLLMGRAEPLVLASISPRRAQLLSMLGVPFRVIEPAGAEDGRRRPEEMPEEYAVRQARAKALTVARAVREGIVLGADTIVYLDGEVLEKPRDAREAAVFLERLSGREHEVVSGICLARAGGEPSRCAHERSAVRFARLDRGTIERYVATGEPLDKAGAYGIQGIGGMLIESIRGCYFNVMGLPLARLRRLFRELPGNASAPGNAGAPPASASKEARDSRPEEDGEEEREG